MKHKLILLAVTLLYALAGQTQLALGQTSGEPIPPTLINTPYPSGSDLAGVIHRPANTAELQNLLSSNPKVLRLGDTIELQAGTIYSGSFRLPKIDDGTGWIVIRTSNLASLPISKRVSPTKASAMPKIEVQSDAPAITFEAGAHNYRLVGLEVRLADSVGINHTALIKVGGDGNEPNESLLPRDIVIDRCYIHGHDAGELKRGVQLNGKYNSVIDSYISKCHSTQSFESQGVAGWDGTGPFKVANNYIEASGENVLFGGGTEVALNRVPSDIEVSDNYLYKPPAWRHVKVVKNLFELKSARRVLVDRNLMENTWAWQDGDPCNVNCDASGKGQVGIAVLFTPRNEKGTDEATWTVVEDVMFKNNIVRHATGVARIIAYDDSGLTQQTRRITITNNLFEDINDSKWAKPDISEPYATRAMLFFMVGYKDKPGPSDVHITHNTGFVSGNLANIIWGGYACPDGGGIDKFTNFIFTDNIAPHNSNILAQAGGVAGGCRDTGNSTLGTFYPDVIFKQNIMMGGDPNLYSNYPNPASPDYFPSNWAAVRFVNMAAGNYNLATTSPASPYNNKGTDGKDIGLSNPALLPVSSVPTVAALPLRINAGGPRYVDSSGKIWLADDYHLTGYTAAPSEVSTTDFPNTTNDVLYRTERFGGGTNINPLSYAIRVPNGSYTVKLHFAEIYFCVSSNPCPNNGVGARVFDLKLEGTTVLPGYDIIVKAGGPLRYKVEELQTSVNDGILNIDAAARANYAKISAIEVISNAAQPTTFWKAPAVNASITGTSGNILTKLTPENAWDAGAYSTKSLTSGQTGYAEFTVGEAGTGKAFGLTNDYAGESYTTIDFALTLGANNYIRIYENNVPVNKPGTTSPLFGTYAAGDKYRVAVEKDLHGNARVVYYQIRSGTTTALYTNTSPTLNYPLVADASLLTGTPASGTIKSRILDARLVVTTMSSSPVREGTFDILWTNDFNVFISENTLTKHDGLENTWDAGASSVQALEGDGYVEFAAADTDSIVICGLNTVDMHQSYQDPDYGILLNASATSSLRIYEKGLLKLDAGTYMIGDRFRVAIEGDSVNYYLIRGDEPQLLYSSPAPTSPVIVDAALKTIGSNITDIVISGAWD
jgi:hypothetical protein